jgi:hypothetical protein
VLTDTLKDGVSIAGYRIDGVLGHGGMGVVSGSSPPASG